jgi:hypothetical protein
MSKFTVIIFSGKRASASYDANRISTQNAELMSEALGADYMGNLHMPCEGMWEGSGEPTHLIAVDMLKGGRELATGLLRAFQQDAVIYGEVSVGADITVATLIEALTGADFVLEYANGSRERSTRARVLPVAACEGLMAYTKLGDTGLALVIDF